MKYRREIDGLRAAAVVPVILFHAGFTAFSGGFVGVDVFFVISGYLITSLILEEMATGRFDLVRFYERRTRRILPALYLVTLACIPFAWAWMLPDDLDVFGQGLVATSLFANNVLLWLTSGYFELANEFKPLMHTWSLGIEEQFYVIFPMLMIMLARRRSSIALWTLSALAIASLGWASIEEARDPLSRFFLLPSRFWELGLGALLAKAETQFGSLPHGPRALREAGALIGLLLIGFCIVAPMEQPMMQVLTPALGAVLVLAYARDTTLAGRLLATPPFVAIGLVSYSAYLWHQPLLAFVRLRRTEPPETALTIAVLAATFGLAFLSWRLVEQQFRRRGNFTRTSVFALSALCGAFIAVTGFALHRHAGFPARWGELSAVLPADLRHLNADYNEGPWRFNQTSFETSSNRKILIVGDSFARDFINMGLANGYFGGGELIYRLQTPECAADAQAIDQPLRGLISHADYLIFAGSSVARDCWSSDFEILSKLGSARMIVVGTKNFGWNPSAVMYLPEHERIAYHTPVAPEVRAQNEADQRAFPSDVFVDLLSAISDASGRVPVLTENGALISQDRRHLSPDGARYVGKIVFEHPLLQPLK